MGAVSSIEEYETKIGVDAELTEWVQWHIHQDSEILARIPDYIFQHFCKDYQEVLPAIEKLTTATFEAAFGRTDAFKQRDLERLQELSGSDLVRIWFWSITEQVCRGEREFVRADYDFFVSNLRINMGWWFLKERPIYKKCDDVGICRSMDLALRCIYTAATAQNFDEISVNTLQAINDLY